MRRLSSSQVLYGSLFALVLCVIIGVALLLTAGWAAAAWVLLPTVWLAGDAARAASWVRQERAGTLPPRR